MNKTQVEKFLKEKELDVQGATAAVTNADLCWLSYVKCKKVLGVDFTPAFGYIGFEPTKIFYQINLKENINRVVKKTYEEYLKNTETLSDKINTQISLQKRIDSLWKKYKEGKIKSVDFLEKYEPLSRDWWILGLIGEDKGDIVSREIVPKFLKSHNLSAQEAVNIINTLSHPSEQSKLSEERKAFLNVCLAYLDNKNLEQKIDFYIKEFFWFKTDFYQATEITKELLVKEVKKELQKKDKQEIVSELEALYKNFKEMEEKKAKLKKEFKLSSEEKKDIKFSELFIYWLDLRKVHMMTQFYYLFSFMKDVSKKTKVPYEDLVPYTFEEFKKFVSGNKKLPKLELEKRKLGAFLVYESDQDQARFFYGKDGKDLLDIAVNAKHVGEIKGQVASIGKSKTVQGVANIILDPSREQFREGDVLVTSMTRVEFVPLMRKAKAIITNEGGIACHAAIVSRELGIPCIIGTKTATKALKTGDKLEMDLTSGIVKKID